MAIVLPFVGLIAAMILVWGWGIDWLHLGLFLGGYILTAFGITIGYHRLFTHRAFETTVPVQVIAGILGSMAVEGPLFKWVGTHRKHHQHADSHDDPHSPHLHGDSWSGLFKGLWHGHVGWIFDPEIPNINKYAGDLQKKPFLRAVHKLFPLWVLLSLIIPTAIAGLYSMTWTGALLGFIWGGLVRVFFVHHVTWSINSVCHLWGARPFNTDDESRNNVIFGVLAMGEGWHNNHHAFPTSARHGLQWWQFDISYYVIKVMGWMGLAWKIKVPDQELIDRKQHQQSVVV